jgi:4'-phosphopantetheinyl transferase
MAGTIYYAHYPMPLPTATFQLLAEQLPVYLQKKIAQFRRWEDAHASLLGKHLLLTALKAYGHTANLHLLRYTIYGRPFLEDNMDFNISHAGRMVACIVSPQGRVGLDVEAIRPIDINDFKGQFTDTEWAAIQNAPNPLHAFYAHWTCKEAILKADGSGLNTALNHLDVTNKSSVVLEGNQWYLHEIKAFPDYACHVATDQKGLQVKVEEVRF